MQRPVAILACLRLYQKNDLSHEDDGRKFKVSTDGGDKLPWEWQLDRDDALQMEAYYRAVDMLVDYLDTEQPEEWTGSRLYRETLSLIVRNAVEMDRYFPIQRSGRTYLLLVPFLREAQVMTVQDAYGPGWKDLLAEDPDTEESTAHYAAAMAPERARHAGRRAPRRGLDACRLRPLAGQDEAGTRRRGAGLRAAATELPEEQMVPIVRQTVLQRYCSSPQ